MCTLHGLHVRTADLCCAHAALLGCCIAVLQVVDDFESYDSGIYDNSDCGSWTNHVMLATG